MWPWLQQVSYPTIALNNVFWQCTTLFLMNDIWNSKICWMLLSEDIGVQEALQLLRSLEWWLRWTVLPWTHFSLMYGNFFSVIAWNHNSISVSDIFFQHYSHYGSTYQQCIKVNLFQLSRGLMAHECFFCVVFRFTFAVKLLFHETFNKFLWMKHTNLFALDMPKYTEK